MKKVILILLMPILIYAGSAGSPGEYLATSANSAKAFGMGSAFTGLADDVSAIYFNPAGLSQLNSKQFCALFAPIFPGLGINLYSLSYSHPILKYGRAGINWLGIFSDDYIGYDFRGYQTGITYSENINNFLLSYASPTFKGVLSGGANIKFIFHSIEGYGRNYFGLGLDLAGFYKPFPYLSTGLMLQNIVPPKMSLSSTKEFFPLNLRFGIAGNLLKFVKQPITIAFDLNFIELLSWQKNNSKPQIRYFSGIEYQFLKILALRAGFNFKEITAGLGVSYFGITLDYSYGYNYKTLLSENQYIRISLLADIDKISIIKKIIQTTPIPTTGQIVMGDRNKNIALDKELDKKINYDIINFNTLNLYPISKNFVGIIVDDYYKFLNENFKQLKFIIPVNESGFSLIYNEKLKEYLKNNFNLIVSFHLPGTYVNLKETGTLDVEKSSKFIKDALINLKQELKLPINEFEIVLPENAFPEGRIDLYLGVLKTISEFVNENKKIFSDSTFILPGYFMLIDNYKTFKRETLEKFKNYYPNFTKSYSFKFQYENPSDKNNIIEIANLNNYLKQYSAEIKNVFQENEITFDAELIYDLKFNQVKYQYFYSLWLANGIKSLLLNKFKRVFLSLKPQAITYQDVLEKNKLLLEIDKMYPDLKITDPKKFEEIMKNIDQKLNIKTEKEEIFDILDEKNKKTAYYIFEIFNKYLFDELVLDKQDYILTKTKDDKKFSFIFINNFENKNDVNLNLVNFPKGVYKVKKILYSNSLYTEKIDPPKVVEDYEVNVVTDLKINDSLLPTSITIILLESESK